MTETVAIYARYSSDNQRDASIEDQVRICRVRAERENWTVIKVFADHAISGATTDRPQYQELMEFIRARRVDIVLTESLDRLSRDAEHLPAFYKLTSYYATRIVTLVDGPVGDVQIGVKAMMGALYLKDLAQKTKRGLEGRIKAGRSIGTAPYGYNVVRRLADNGEPERGLREIDPAEAAIVRRIFREYVGGASPMRIAKALNAEAIPGPAGGIWYDASIRGHADRGDGVLRNPVYIGQLVWNRQQSVRDPVTSRRHRRANAPEEVVTYEATELRIISDDIWRAAEDRLIRERAILVPRTVEDTASSSYAFWKQRRPKHLLSGKVICGCCGRKFLTSGKDYMRCLAAANGGCNNRASVRGPKLEACVLQAMSKNLMAPEDVAEFIQAFAEEWQTIAREIADTAQVRRRELTTVARKIDNLVDAIADGGRNGALQAKLSKLTADYEELRIEVGQESIQLPPLEANLAQIYHRQIDNLQQVLARESATESRERFRDLIDRIVVYPPEDGGKPKIEFIGDLTNMLSLGGIAPSKQPQAQNMNAISLLVSSIKAGQGALPPGPPLKAEPLKSISFRQGEGDPGQISGKSEAAPSPCLKLAGSKG